MLLILLCCGLLLAPCSAFVQPLQLQQCSTKSNVRNSAVQFMSSNAGLQSRRSAVQSIVQSITVATVVSSAAPALAAEKPPTKTLEECITSIERVRQSCAQLEESIEKGEYGDLKVLIKSLIRNYKVCITSLQYVCVIHLSCTFIAYGSYNRMQVLDISMMLQDADCSACICLC
jgi:hypothetical protein